jgi:hypothetical protein
MADPLAMVSAMLRDARIARLATVTPSGRATVAPYWFFFDGDRIFIDTVENPTVGHVRRDPRVSLLVDFGTGYSDLRGAIVHGSASAYRPAEAPDWVRRGIAGYAAKYAVHDDERTGAGDAHRTRRLPGACLVVAPERARWFTVGGYFQGVVDWPARDRGSGDQASGDPGT